MNKLYPLLGERVVFSLRVGQKVRSNRDGRLSLVLVEGRQTRQEKLSLF